MNNSYLNLKENDPVIHIKMPTKMLQDLMCRCRENGSKPNIEILIRLARSLEKNLE